MPLLFPGNTNQHPRYVCSLWPHRVQNRWPNSAVVVKHAGHTTFRDDPALMAPLEATRSCDPLLPRRCDPPLVRRAGDPREPRDPWEL